MIHFATVNYHFNLAPVVLLAALIALRALRVDGAIDYRSIADAGAFFSCAVEETDLNVTHMEFWGTASNSIPLPERIHVTNPIAVSAGQEHLCLIAGRGSTFQCWGKDAELTNIPDAISSARGDISDFQAGGAQTCVSFFTTGEILCFGIAHGDSLLRPAAMGRATSLATSKTQYHTCAIAQNITSPGIGDIDIFCWGCTAGNNAICDSIPRHLLAGADSLTAAGAKLAVGQAHACAWIDETFECWGDNTYGQLDVPDGGAYGNVVAGTMVAGDDFTCVLNGGESVTDVEARSVGLIGEGDIVCWGRSDTGVTDIPKEVQDGVAISISAGAEHVCATYSKANVTSAMCWGQNSGGQVSPLPSFLGSGISSSVGTWKVNMAALIGAASLLALL